MDFPITSPVRLEDLVEYQPGSVVSRVIFRNEGGSQTLFAFAEGGGLGEHTNPNDAVILVLEGSAEVTVGGVGHVVGIGEALYLPASVPHALDGGPPFKMLLTLLKAGGA